METKTVYVSFDGQYFDTEKDCLEYEKDGIDKQIESLHKELQYLKSGVLAGEDKLFNRAKAQYRRACTEKMSTNQRIVAFEHYARISERYHQAKVKFQRIKQQIKFLRDKKTETNQA